jgi:hypothetical protein
VFDAAFVGLLVLSTLRARAARSALGVAMGVASLALLVVVGALALQTDKMTWGTAGVFGLAFVGPSAILQERSGALGILTNPLAMSLALAFASTVSAVSFARRARDLYPESSECRALHRAELAFVGTASFAAIRLVTAILALALFRDR